MTKPLDPTRPNGPRLSDGSLLAGEEANYTKFDNTGHQTMEGTAKPWDDLRIEPVARNTGAAAPVFELWLTSIYLYSFDDGATSKEIFFAMQMPHSWDGGSIYMHVHWIGNVDDTTAEPLWRLDYTWKEPGEVYGAETITYAKPKYPVDANVTAFKHYLSAFPAIAPGTSADGLSSILLGRLIRANNNAFDTYNVAGNKCGLLYIDAHYQLNSLGSTDEYTK